MSGKEVVEIFVTFSNGFGVVGAVLLALILFRYCRQEVNCEMVSKAKSPMKKHCFHQRRGEARQHKREAFLSMCLLSGWLVDGDCGLVEPQRSE